MREARFYVPREALSGNNAVIKGDQARHIISILRKKPGDYIVLFDGEGTQFAARIVRIDRELVVARVTAREVHKRAGGRAIGLYVAVPKGRRFDLVVEGGTELGADSITPLVTTRTVVKLDDYNITTKLDRWRRISVAAAKQCRRATLPQINSPVDFSTAIKELPEWVFPILAGSLDRNPPIYDVLEEMGPAHKEVRIYIGPEGGFSREETEQAGKAGIRLASLGENILRTEMAAVASLAVIICFLGRENMHVQPRSSVRQSKAPPF
ncbi:16S rRNA (uracil(1498)-N(3))-methyltransferase [bacterium]|nr:16S rRNA (uracil(1498)-N(3))-methyltransferase [bacterium]